MITAGLLEKTTRVYTNANAAVCCKTSGVILPNGSLVRTPVKDSVKFSGTQTNCSEKVRVNTVESYENYKAWADKYLDVEKLRSIFVPENKIGRGAEGIVYEIPGNDKYVLKVSNYFDNSCIMSTKIHKYTDHFPDLNIGQPVAVIDDCIQVLKKQCGIPGVTYKDIERLGQEDADKLYIKTMEDIALMPVEAYYNLAESYKRLEEKGFKVDPFMADNLLIDLKHKRLNLVDVGYEPGCRNTPENMILSLLNYRYATFEFGIKDPDTLNKLVNLRSQILDKCIEACEAKGLLPKDENDEIIQDVFAISGRKKDEWSKVCAKLMKASR